MCRDISVDASIGICNSPSSAVEKIVSFENPSDGEISFLSSDGGVPVVFGVLAESERGSGCAGSLLAEDFKRIYWWKLFEQFSPKKLIVQKTHTSAPLSSPAYDTLVPNRPDPTPPWPHPSVRDLDV